MEKLEYNDCGAGAKVADTNEKKIPTEVSPKNKEFIPGDSYLSPAPLTLTLSPYDFQIEALKWTLRNPRTYLALSPGLGKTIVAALLRNTLELPMVFVSPPFLCANAEIEFKRWASRKISVTRFGRDDIGAPLGCGDVLIVPDSLLCRVELSSQLPSKGFVVVDEATRFKKPLAKRTKALFSKIVKRYERVVYMSGTPILSRPIELFTVLKSSAPHTINNLDYFGYGKRYCGGYQTQWGWDFSGHSNLEELSRNVRRDFMLVIKKEDVLKSLPPKTEQIVFIDKALPKELASLERSLLKSMKPAEMTEIIGNAHLSTYRRELGEKKAEYVATFLNDILEETNDAILVFAIHKRTIEKLCEALSKYSPLVITGDVPNQERQKRVERFQESQGPRIMILNTQAGGVGFTLTKASRVVFAEIPWTPGDVEQCSDRAHRIGQRGNVLVQFLVFRESLDALVLDVVLAKRNVLKRVSGH